MKLTKPSDLNIITNEEVIKEKAFEYIRLIEDRLVNLKIKNGMVSFIVSNIDTEHKDFEHIYAVIKREYKNIGWKDIKIKYNNYKYANGVGTMEMDYIQVAGKVTLYI